MTRIRLILSVHSSLKVKVRLQQGCMLLSFVFTVVDIVNNLEARLSELLYADDSVLMSENVEGFRNKYMKWKEVFESMDMKIVLQNQSDGQRIHFKGWVAYMKCLPMWILQLVSKELLSSDCKMW